MSSVEPGHPRAESLRIRERLAKGFESGLVAPEGLAAHGRGEAFDYILGEQTTQQAQRAIKAAVATLLTAERPVLSVNGNVAALVPSDIVELAKVIGAKLEVNLFHSSAKRERAIADHLRDHGAKEILGVEEEHATKIQEIHSDRRKVDGRGIAAADVVFVPLEDGDRAEALKKLGKKVVALDLNPLSRTARAADVTIVDNIVRSLPLMIKEVDRLSSASAEEFEGIVQGFENEENLRSVIEFMLNRLGKLSEE
jgi:4-phosphopantoate--beta-alanine ligase